MADVYRDFAFAALAGDIDDATSAWAVDDVTSLPSNALLAKGDFWVVAESALVHPSSFEIVKLTGVDISTATLTVLRGQRGTARVAHPAGTLLKGALTTDMLRQIRGGNYGPRLPPPDGDLYAPGERFYCTGEGVFYEHTGMQLRFAQESFTPANVTTGSDSLADIAPTAGTGAALSGCTLQWRQVAGVIGVLPSSDARHDQAVPKTASAGRALALLNMGSGDFAVKFLQALGASSDVDAGFLLRVNADASTGYYLSLTPGAPPKLFRLAAGSASLVFTFTSDVLATSDLVEFNVRARGDVIDFWYQTSGMLFSNFHLRASYTETEPFEYGTNIGLLANSAECFTDTNLGWTYLGAPIYARQGVATNNLSEPFFRMDATGAADDQPTTMTGWYPFTEDWVNVVGVFGVVTNGGYGQVGRYQSGAVADRAVALQDLHGTDFDVTSWFVKPADASADYGLMLRASSDSDTGLYLAITDQLNLYAVIGGAVNPAPLAASSLPSVDDTGVLGVRVVATQDHLSVYDGLDTSGTPLFTASVASTTGGSWFGWMLRNAAAISDTDLSFYNLNYNDLGLTGGWRAESNFLVGSGPPRGSAPAGATWFDFSSGETYLSIGVGQPWRRFGRVTTAWAGISPSAPWTGTAQWYRDNERTYFRGALSGGGTTDPLFDVSIFPPDDNGAGSALLAALRKSDGTYIATVLTYSAASGLRCPGMLTGATMLLDGLSWRHQ